MTCAYQDFQYTIGSFLSAVSLNIVTNQPPHQWRHAVLSQFAVSGVSILGWFFLPESPRWHCTQGRGEKCKEILQKVNGNVEGYDVEQEYSRMLIEIKNVEISKSITGGGTYFDVFRGTNFVRSPSLLFLCPSSLTPLDPASTRHFLPAMALAGSHRSPHHWHVLCLFLQHGRAQKSVCRHCRSKVYGAHRLATSAPC